MVTQLPLDFRLRDEAILDRFIAGSNQELLAEIQSIQDNNQKSLFVVGAVATGKTHLLQASSRLLPTSIYLPLKEIDKYSPDMFEGFAEAQLICLDDIDCLAGNAEMELALFSFINQLKEQGASFIFSASQKADQCGFGLKDLVSRLNACIPYTIHELDDESKRLHLFQDAEARGLVFTREVVDWILVHKPRDMRSLAELMNLLDRESLAAQRRITIPFLRATIKG